MSVSSRWSEIGALSAAGTVAATILCCVPFATGLLGAVLAAFGARVAPFQPYLTAASLGLLGYAFYQAYRRDPACPAGACDRPSSLRRRRIVLWIVSVVVVALLTGEWWANWVIYWSLS